MDTVSYLKVLGLFFKTYAIPLKRPNAKLEIIRNELQEQKKFKFSFQCY